MASSLRVPVVAQAIGGLSGALAIFIVLTLPPRTAHLNQTPDLPLVAYGAYHVHSNRSDGTGSVDDIAAAAASAGLQFVIITDHGDGTRPTDPPQYRHGVLCIDAVEVGSAAGHVVALGLDGPAPYPLGGEASDVVDDLHRLGAWVVLAHPESPRAELRWRSSNITFEGIEWLNLDSEWRDESNAHLAGMLLRYPFRPAEAIASLIQRPVLTLRRWDQAGRGRLVTGLGAVDAHARVPWPARRDPDQGGAMAALPAYVQTFKAVAQAAVLDRPMSGRDGVADAKLVIDALHAGRAFSAITAFASPARLSFSATRDQVTYTMGQWIADGSSTPAVFHAQVNDPNARIALIHNGAESRSGFGTLDTAMPVTPGPYRIEAYRPGSTVPWIVSNAIYGGTPAIASPSESGRGGPPDPPPALRLVPVPGAGEWAIEKNATSIGASRPDGKETRFDFQLGGGPAFDQFAALVSAIDEAQAQEGFDRVQFTVRADRSTRFSVQLRLPGRGDQRWRRSIFADATPRTIVAHLQEFQPVDRITSNRPIVAHLRTVLFVVDTLNSRPSTRGTIWLSDVSLGVGQTER